MAPEMLLLTSDKLTEKVGFVATKVLARKGYTRSVDWWALGVTTYRLLVGSRPFLTEELCELRNSMIRKFRKDDSFELGNTLAEVYQENINFHEYISLFQRIYYPNFLSDTAKDFISKLLEVNEAKRLGSAENGFKDIQNHPFFADIDWEKLVKRQVSPPYVPVMSEVSVRRYNCNDIPTVHSQAYSPVAPSATTTSSLMMIGRGRSSEVKDFYELLEGSSLLPQSGHKKRHKKDFNHIQKEHQKYFDKW
jgi:serine/threonine protein kinase